MFTIVFLSSSHLKLCLAAYKIRGLHFLQFLKKYGFVVAYFVCCFWKIRGWCNSLELVRCLVSFAWRPWGLFPSSWSFIRFCLRVECFRSVLSAAQCGSFQHTSSIFFYFHKFSWIISSVLVLFNGFIFLFERFRFLLWSEFHFNPFLLCISSCCFVHLFLIFGFLMQGILLQCTN